MKARLFKGVWVQPGSKTMELLEAGKTKEAERLSECCRKMYEANYNYDVVQKIRKANPDLY